MVWWIGALGALIVGGTVLVLAAARAGALAGHMPADLGVRDGRLKPASGTRNSVSSQAAETTGAGAEYARIEPLRFEGGGAEAMARLRAILASTPGARIVQERPDYLYVQFTTRWLRFVDDAEFYLAPGARQIELRSASRLGREDFGVNRQRIESIRARLASR